MKKLIAIILSLTMLTLTGCSLTKKKETAKDDSSNSKSSATVAEKTSINPLTGLDIDPDKSTYRPVAVMINNINIAQPVQTGVNKADIVYETEVEGGITRLMAVFKDITTVEQLGTIRSARYAYVDLAAGHDALYAHCGQDPRYCAPHLKDIDDISVETGRYGGTRIKNGLSSEHTLYTYGDKLYSSISDAKFRTTSKNNDTWQNFAKSDEKIVLSGGTCKKVTIPFSNSYNTVFNYDSQKGKYTRSFGTTVRTDYVTKDTTDVKNVFVLMTSISTYSTDPEQKHRNIALDGGTGYYFANGTYTAIKWEKGSCNNPIKFKDSDGNPLKVNAGNSWVCITDKGTSQPVIE